MNLNWSLLILIALCLNVWACDQAESEPPGLRFLVTADPQYRIDEIDPDKGSAINADYIAAKIKDMILNDGYKGLILAGDLTHFAKPEELFRYQQSIEGFEAYVFDGIGNHDYEFVKEGDSVEIGIEGFGLADVLPDLTRDWNDDTYRVWETVRSRERITPINTSYPNLHYSWDWEDIHFVQLNLFPGDEPVNESTVHNPLKALSFLQADLQQHVGNSGRPVILVQHYGFDDFSLGVDSEGNINPKGQWWSPEQRSTFWEAIEPYNIVVIFSGHAHSCRPVCYLPWDGENIGEEEVGEEFIPSFIAGASREGYYIECEVNETELTVKRFKREELLMEKTLPLYR
ncbi:MAG: metallophosphoesterase [Bacteroidota bacterium]